MATPSIAALRTLDVQHQNLLALKIRGNPSRVPLHAGAHVHPTD
jgi:hypothetical protein